MGCGDAGFIASLVDAARIAGCHLTGINLKPDWERESRVLDAVRHADVELICGDVMVLDAEPFDLITACGVVSFNGAMLSVPSPWDANAMRQGMQVAQKLTQKALDMLTDLKSAAFITTTIGTVLMLRRVSVEQYAHIALWDQTRHFSNYGPILDTLRDSTAQTIWGKLCRHGAGLAVLRAKRDVETGDPLVQQLCL